MRTILSILILLISFSAYSTAQSKWHEKTETNGEHEEYDS